MHRSISRASVGALAALLVLLLSACPLDPERSARERELRANRRLWSERRVPSYRYVVRHSCFCPPEVVEPVVVTVRDGAVVERRYQATGSPAMEQGRRHWPAVEGLFDLVEDAVERRAHEIDVEYHPRLGYPVTIRIDLERNAVDEEQEYTASELEPLP